MSQRNMSDKAISTDSLLQESRTFPPPPEILRRAHLNAAQYDAMYERSIREPEAFWLEQAKTLGLVQATNGRAKIHLGHRRANHPAHLVRGWPAQRDRQLPRPPSEDQNAR